MINDLIMPALRRSLVVLSFVLICSGCKSPVWRALEDVGSYIQERPDSALAVLEAMDTAAIVRPCDIAKYSLLHTMAIDKNYIDTTDLRLIEPAVEYYTKHGSKEDRMKSLFYLGRLNRYSGNCPEAIVAGMKAKALAEKSGDLYWRAMTTSELGYVYNSNYSTGEQLRYALEAYDLWREYDDPVSNDQAGLNLALAYHNNRLFDKADSIYEIFCSRPDTLFRAFVRRLKNEVERPVPDYEKAKLYFETAVSHGAYVTVESYYQYAYALASLGHTDSAYILLEQLERYPEDIHSSYFRYRIAKQEGDWESSAAYLDSYSHRSDSIVRHQLSQSVFKAQNSQLKYEVEIEKSKRLLGILWMSLAILAVAIAGILSYLLFKRRRRALAEENERLSRLYDESVRMLETIRIQDELDRNSSRMEIQSMESKLMRLRSSFARLYQNHFVEVGKLFDFTGSGDAEARLANVKKDFSEKMDSIVTSLRRDTRNQAEFERIIDEDLDGIMGKLRADYPNFSEADFQLLSYCIAGFDPITCSILLDKDTPYIRMKKARLTQRICKSPTPNNGLYMSFLEPRHPKRKE